MPRLIGTCGMIDCVHGRQFDVASTPLVYILPGEKATDSVGLIKKRLKSSWSHVLSDFTMISVRGEGNGDHT